MTDQLDRKNGLFSLHLTMKEGLPKVNYCWMGRKSWHAINLPTIPDSQGQVSNKVSYRVYLVYDCGWL